MTDHDPDKCACRWGEQPCWMCLPVLDARFREQQMQKTLGPTVAAIRAHNDATKGDGRG